VCFAFDARPPDLPADLVHPRMAGGAGAEKLELTSADGTVFSAALAESAEDANGPAVIILPDVRGLYRFYIELAERFAQAGHHAIALDYFGRTAGTGERDGDWEYMPHVEQTLVSQIQADADAARAALVDKTGATSFVTVGFCFGGLQSFLAATSPELMLDGAVGFYGVLSGGRFGMPRMLDHVGETRCPVLGLFGGADQAIPTSDVDTYDRLLGEAGVEHEVVIYPGAPHSFFDRSFAEWKDAGADSWRRILEFVAGHSQVGSAA
jgi:carboxymethylenebutenolidase